MSKIKVHEIDQSEKYKIIGNFYEVVANLKSKKEIIDFFIGLLTPSEAIMIARRIQLAQMLTEDNYTYESIRNKLGVGYKTIANAEKWINSDDKKYNKWIRKCIQTRSNSKKDTKSNYKNMLDKYPQHRFLKELFRI